jgi:hypothetical protein
LFLYKRHPVNKADTKQMEADPINTTCMPARKISGRCGNKPKSHFCTAWNQPDQLTHNLKFDKATTARAVKHLAEAGYIDRMVDEKDRRSYRLYPTKKGLSSGHTAI